MRLLKLSCLLLFCCTTLCSKGNIISARDWNYLYSDAFKLRYAVAAHMLKNCNELIEIGCYKTPISDFVHDKDRIVLIDPLLETKPRAPGVESYQQLFSEATYAPLKPPYGVILIGMDLKYFENDFKRLYALINHSHSVVIEHSSNWKQSKEHFKTILKNTNKKITQRIELDFSGNNFGDLRNSWPVRSKRTMYLLQ